jgi:hypothetical protein
MHMLERRVHILLDRARYERLVAEARTRRVSVASLIREAIDLAFPSTSARKSAALKRILEAPDMPLPDHPADLKREIEEARDRFS